jgi:translation initiation factor 2D
MFKKKPSIKPLAPLRSSDRRKTADQIISDLGLSPPSPSDESTRTPEEKAAATAHLSALRNSLLPENAVSARFTTTHGPDLKLFSGTVYAGSHPGEEQRILWVKMNDRLVPTLYTLWKNPRIVPLLHTHPPVISKLQGGADLMTPGLANGPPFPSAAMAGAIVAIASTSSPSVPLVVGTCEIDVSTLQQVQGAKGHAVQTITWAGDELWSWSPSGKTGDSPPESIDSWQEPHTVSSVDAVTDAVANVTISAQPGQSNETTADAEEPEDISEQRQWSTRDIDDAFRNAFLYAVYKARASGSPPFYGIVFPLRQSSVMDNLIKPYLPTFTKADTEALQIKKTSWKTMKKFIKSLDKEKLIKSKDRDAEAIIVDINFDDQAFVKFQRYPLPQRQTGGLSAASANQSTELNTADSSVGQTIKIITLFKVKDKLAPLFGELDSKGYFTSSELKEATLKYTESENLVSEKNKRIINLNPFLSNVLIDGRHPNDKDVLARKAILRDALVERVQFACSPYYLIMRNTPTPDKSSKPKAGSAPKVLITLETRSGNKTVTKVSGLEAFFIPPQPLADELRKTCAGSTSVDQLVGSSPKNPVMEVMIQGPQKQAVLSSLEKRGVASRWIDILDKTKKK